MTDQNQRTSEHGVAPIFLERWSPRAFVPQAMPQADLLTILEAARFAPSAVNLQPWRFIYAHRDTPAWEKMLPTLYDFNAGWAKNASVMLLLFSQKTTKAKDTGEDKAVISHAFDAGAAWMSLALQAQMLGYHAHAMGGVHHDKTAEIYDIPASYRLEVGIVIGKRGDAAVLPETLQAREGASPRKPLAEIAREGEFPG